MCLMPLLFPRCRRMTAVTSSQVLTKKEWRHLLTNTTLTGPVGLMALMVSCHLRVMMNTKRRMSFLPTAACLLVCTVLMRVKTVSLIWYWKILMQNNVNAVAFWYDSVQRFCSGSLYLFYFSYLRPFIGTWLNITSLLLLSIAHSYFKWMKASLVSC